jgi:hypothetical protein
MPKRMRTVAWFTPMHAECFECGAHFLAYSPTSAIESVRNHGEYAHQWSSSEMTVLADFNAGPVNLIKVAPRMSGIWKEHGYDKPQFFSSPFSKSSLKG